MTEEEEKDFVKELREVAPATLTPSLLEQLELNAFAGGLLQYTPHPVSERFQDEVLEKISEEELQAFTAKPLRPEFLESLVNLPLEVALQDAMPKPLTSQQLDRFTNAIEEAESQVLKEKVIEFPVASNQKKTPFPIRWYASAAAVAIMGVFAGFLAFGGDAPEQKAVANAPVSKVPSSFSSQPIANGDLVNVSLNSQVVGAEDRGIVPHRSSNQYYRAMKVISMETYLVTNEQGEQIKVQKPVEKIIMVPAHTD